MAEKRLLKRSEVRTGDTWAMEDLYKNDEAWEADFKRLAEEIPVLRTYEGRLGESASVLLRMQRKSDELNMLAEKIYVYAAQKLHEDTENGRYQELANRAQGLLVKLSEAGAYMEPELLGLPEGTVEQFLEENKELVVYRQYFENMMRQREHVLDREREEMLAAVGELAEHIAQAARDAAIAMREDIRQFVTIV